MQLVITSPGNTGETYPKHALKYQDTIYLLYDGKVVNPVFFNTIVIDRPKLSDDDLRMLYNMLLVGGTIHFPHKYTAFFKSAQKTVRNTFYVTKHTNLQYVMKYSRVVEFIIAGVQKGGTTALAHNIGKHPDISISANKDPFKSEIHYFDIHFGKGLEWYKKHFNYGKRVVGEKTPDLLYLSYTFPLIQSVNPYVKFIIILRNPILRAFSGYKLSAKYFGETRTFEDAIDHEIARYPFENVTFYTAVTHYLHRGLYYKQIKKLLKWFPAQNILILVSETVKANMAEEYGKVYEFLNLRPHATTYDLQFETEDKKAMSPATYADLVEFYRSDVANLEQLLGITTGWL